MLTASASIITLVPNFYKDLQSDFHLPPQRLRQTYEPLPTGMDKLKNPEMAKTRPITKNIWYQLYD